MSSPELSKYAGPPLNVESWIEKGQQGHWLTGKGATGDTAHIEINHDPYAEEQWVRLYAEGRKAYRDPRIEQARKFDAADKPAEAIVAAKMVLDIPWRGQPFMYNQGCVVRALGMKDTFNEPLPEPVGDESENEVALRSLRENLLQTHIAMQEAFDTPPEVKIELEDIVRKDHQASTEQEIAMWAAATQNFGKEGELHAAGIAAFELGNAYGAAGNTNEAVSTYVAAGKLLHKRLDIVMGQGDEVQHTAEVDTIFVHLEASLRALVDVYLATDKVKGEDKEILKAAVYELDDITGADAQVASAYKLLAASSHLREKHFYKVEARGIADDLWIAEWFRNNPGAFLMGGPPPRPDRRRLRPPVQPADESR